MASRDIAWQTRLRNTHLRAKYPDRRQKKKKKKEKEQDWEPVHCHSNENDERPCHTRKRAKTRPNVDLQHFCDEEDCDSTDVKIVEMSMIGLLVPAKR